MNLITLGLDLGVASIGWALISENMDHAELVNWGSRIFEPGMDDDIDAGKGTSRCADRRLKRALRKQYLRSRMRKDKLTDILQREGFLPQPLTPAFFTDLDKRLLMTFSVEERGRIGHVLPYFYRKKALDVPLSKPELGRALYHLAQRRGYMSNRKQDLKNAEESGVVKKGIQTLREEMTKAKARTLGEYFSGIDPEKTRIRTRYTERSMYQEEFHLICQSQRKLISEALENELFNAIFFQRKLKSCKGLIGHCELYPEEKRCSYLQPEAQLFRIYTNVNHLRVECKSTIRPLTEEEQKKAVEVLNGFSDALNMRGTITLAALGKKIPLAKGEKFTLGDDEKEIYGNELNAILFRVFGERAANLPPEERQKFFHDLNSIEKDTVLLHRLTTYWNLTELDAEKAMKAALPDDYCAFSLKALRELLVELQKGIPLSTVLKFSQPDRNRVLEQLPLVDDSGIELRNPVVHRVMTELRYVVNTIIARYGKPNRIRIELARSLKSTNKERERITKQLREREKERAKIVEKICQEAGIEKPSRNDILKVMLAEECDYICPYTGKRFSMYDLLHGKDIHIEHILPYSRSFDDSFRNKTLCDASANSRKGNHTPYEAFSGEEYQAILTRVSHFKGPYATIKKDLFELKEFQPEEFLERNLNDTRYASRLAMKYLSLLYGGLSDARGKQCIFATSGGTTAMIRRAWGGNYLLGEGEKVRDDHRHHAIDALTIALTTPGLVKKIAGMTPEERRKLREENTPFLGNALYEQAKAKLEKAAVSHHVVNKIRGAFHKETIYGKDYGDGVRHIRKALSAIDPKEIANIIDPAIRLAVMEKLGMSSPDQPVDAKALKIFNEEKNLPVLKNRKGEPVNTIKKVRVTQTVNTRSIGQGDWHREVANGVNHVLAVFADLDAQGNETGWSGEIVSLLDAKLRLEHGQPVFDKKRPGKKFKFSLRKGDIVSWTRNGREELCIVRGVSLPQFQLVHLNDARISREIKAAKEWFTPTVSAAFAGKMRKFRMNLFGELQNAND